MIDPSDSRKFTKNDDYMSKQSINKSPRTTIENVYSPEKSGSVESSFEAVTAGMELKRPTR